MNGDDLLLDIQHKIDTTRMEIKFVVGLRANYVKLLVA